MGNGRKTLSPSMVLTIIFMAIMVVANVTAWTIIMNKVDEKLENAAAGNVLTLDADTRSEIVTNAADQLTDKVKESVEDSLQQRIAREYYLPEDYTNPGLYVGSQNLYNVIELTCSGRQKTGPNDSGTDYNVFSRATGTIISSDGYVITNAHVVTFENYNYTASNIGPFIQYYRTSYSDIFPSIVGKFAGHSAQYTFEVVACDTTKDLALIKIKEAVPADLWKTATLTNSTLVQMGEEVIALGNAQGYGINMTYGIVSKYAFYDEDYTEYLIQTDAAINPGNSGGALYNVRGEIVGINSAKIVGNEIEGMGFAIASNSVKTFIDAVAAEKGITVHYDYRAE